MFLVIDVGNTHTVLGIYDGDELIESWRVATGATYTADESRIKLHALITMAGISVESIEGAILSSVVPAVVRHWTHAVRYLLGKDPLIVSLEACKGLFETTYPYPEEIGADYLADAVAAREKHGAPVVVVDFGTATNISIIDRDGVFLGGIIAPGVRTSAEALFGNAAMLDAIDLVDPGTAIGKSTAHCIQSGIVYGEAGRIDGLVSRIFDELGYEAPVVATGGFSAVIGPVSKTITETDPELTLRGLQLIYLNNQ